MKYSKVISTVLALAALVCLNPPLTAQEDTPPPATQAEAEPAPAAVEAEATQPVSDAEIAEQAMEDLLGSRKAAPVIEPNQQSPALQPGPAASGAPAASIDIDPAVLGIAPGEDPPPLRREGEFIVNRRGRLIQSAEGGHLLFVFESDSADNPELPMVLQACQLLEAMENEVHRRGDSTIFRVSGQINTYRGANYLLPTMMIVVAENGNLTN